MRWRLRAGASCGAGAGRQSTVKTAIGAAKSLDRDRLPLMRSGSVMLAGMAVLAAGCASPVEEKVQAYRQAQVRELVAAYEQARNRGDLLDMCVKGNLISGAYVDAGQQGDALAWRTRSAEDCRAARAAIAPQTLGAE
jgi:hypothetical protein